MDSIFPKKYQQIYFQCTTHPTVHNALLRLLQLVTIKPSFDFPKDIVEVPDSNVNAVALVPYFTEGIVVHKFKNFCYIFHPALKMTIFDGVLNYKSKSQRFF